MNFNLRKLELSDLDNLVKYANNEKVSAYMTDDFPHPYTEEDGMNFLLRFKDDEPANIMAIDIDGFVGAIGLHKKDGIMRNNAEMGYWIAEPYWGKGIITEAVKQMVKYGFKTFEIDRIFARPYGNNPASQRVLEKAGFTLEARFERTIIKRGQRLDELVYAVRKS